MSRLRTYYPPLLAAAKKPGSLLQFQQFWFLVAQLLFSVMTKVCTTLASQGIDAHFTQSVPK